MPAQARPIQPLLAARAIAALVRDPQDTPQVFTVINALRGRTTLRRMERFRATAAGRRLLAAPRSLLDHLGDREGLAALPPGTLGRVYHDFMAEENLSAQGLATVSANVGDKRMTPDELRYFHRMRDTHDLLHVLTGYGPLAAGGNLRARLQLRATGWPRRGPDRRRRHAEGCPCAPRHGRARRGVGSLSPRPGSGQYRGGRVGDAARRAAARASRAVPYPAGAALSADDEPHSSSVTSTGTWSDGWSSPRIWRSGAADASRSANSGDSRA